MRVDALKLRGALLGLLVLVAPWAHPVGGPLWQADLGDGRYRNPSQYVDFDTIRFRAPN